jgi:tRNA A-37 threonylcarbamoyl transferase component Bud32
MAVKFIKQARCKVSESVLATLHHGNAEAENIFHDKLAILKSDMFSYAGVYKGATDREVAFVKCYKPKSLLNKIALKFGWARCYRAYQAALALSGCVSMPYPYALVRNQSSFNVYVFYQQINSISVSDLFKDRSFTSVYAAVLRQCGKQLAALHMRGWTHGDYKWGNVLVALDAEKSIEGIYIVDLDGVKKNGAKNDARGRDLARFIVNAEDYGVDESLVRGFVDAYAKATGETFRYCIDIAWPGLEKLRLRHDKKYDLRKRSLFQAERKK